MVTLSENMKTAYFRIDKIKLKSNNKIIYNNNMKNKKFFN